MNEMSDASGVELSLLKKAMKSAIPISGSLELLPLCNMNCNMCYVRLNNEQMKAQGRISTSREWLSVAEQMQNAGTLFLLLTGGEPLLYSDFESLYTGLRKLGIVVTLNTNGTLIDEKWVDFFEANKPRRINITLYGTNPDTYERLCHYREGFDRTINAIKLLSERKVDVKINFSAVSANKNDVSAAMNIADMLGVPINVDSYMYPSVRERNSKYDFGQRLSPDEAAVIWIQNLKHSLGDGYENYIRSLLEIIENRKQIPPPKEEHPLQCMASNCSFTVNWQGYMRPCVMLSAPSVSVFDDGFLSAWNAIRSEVKALSVNEKCHRCHLRPICHICPASAAGECGTYDAVPQYLCDMANEIYNRLSD